MRLEAKLLSPESTLNNLRWIPELRIMKGDTAELWLQLWDSEKGHRYIPAAGATLKVDISRFKEYIPAANNTREEKDYSVSAFATQPISDDKSIWKLALTTAQTLNITSSAIKLTLTQGSDVKICAVPMAIVAYNPEE